MCGVTGLQPLGITEKWWDGSRDWSAAMDGYKLYREDRPERRKGGYTLCERAAGMQGALPGDGSGAS